MTQVEYAALLRGVSPTNAPSAELRAAFEAAGFDEVSTVLASGNVLFRAGRRSAPATVRRRAERALEERLGRTFLTIVRPVDELRALIAADPWKDWPLADGAKKVVTFHLSEPAEPPPLPVVHSDGTIHDLRGTESLCSYVPGPRGGAFMTVIERTFGKEVTTRTWDTVRRLAR